MICSNCRKPVAVKREFCPHCGQRVEMVFDDIAHSVKEDATARRWRDAEKNLIWLLGALILAGVIIHGINGLWSKPVVYDGADTPAVSPPPVPEGRPEPR